MMDPGKMMNQIKRNNHSRSAILNKLRQVSAPSGGRVRMKYFSEGPVFPKVNDLLSPFKDELEQWRGEVVLCDGVGVQMGCLKELKEKRGWSMLACLDPGLKERLNSYGIIRPRQNCRY